MIVEGLQTEVYFFYNITWFRLEGEKVIRQWYVQRKNICWLFVDFKAFLDLLKRFVVFSTTSGLVVSDWQMAQNITHLTYVLLYSKYLA